jgi:hypothetical protein
MSNGLSNKSETLRMCGETLSSRARPLLINFLILGEGEIQQLDKSINHGHRTDLSINYSPSGKRECRNQYNETRRELTASPLPSSGISAISFGEKYVSGQGTCSVPNV